MERETAEYLIHLLKSVLHQSRPEEKPENVNFEKVYELAKFHSVQCMAFYAVEQLQRKPEESLYKTWKQERDQHILKSIVQLEERDALIRTFTENDICIIPLKGCLLKEMYPQEDYRQMADIDLLFEKKKERQTKELMEERGYHAEYFGLSHHDVYLKKPFLNVELHRELFSKEYEEWYGYYEDIWKKAVRDQENPKLFHLSWDDFMIFEMVHFARHYFNGGSGIRSILDLFVLMQHHGTELHRDYLKRELTKLNLWKFYFTANKLANVWFGDGIPDDDTKEMAEYVLTSGTYGTRERGIQNRLQRSVEKAAGSPSYGVVLYIIKRAFLKKDSMCMLYPFLQKYPILLPFCWIHRLAASIFLKRAILTQELRGIKKILKKGRRNTHEK